MMMYSCNISKCVRIFFKLFFHTALLTNARLVISRVLVDCHINGCSVLQKLSHANNTSMAFMPSLDFKWSPAIEQCQIKKNHINYKKILIFIPYGVYIFPYFSLFWKKSFSRRLHKNFTCELWFVFSDSGCNENIGDWILYSWHMVRVYTFKLNLSSKIYHNLSSLNFLTFIILNSTQN